MALWSHGEVWGCVFLQLCAQGTSYPFSFACCGQNGVAFAAFSTSITLKVPLQESDSNKVLCIRTPASHLQGAGFFFSPPTTNWIYSLFNNCLPLKPDVFRTWKWGSETGGYELLTPEPHYLYLIDMDIVLFIITWRWEEACKVRQM